MPKELETFTIVRDRYCPFTFTVYAQIPEQKRLFSVTKEQLHKLFDAKSLEFLEAMKAGDNMEISIRMSLSGDEHNWREKS